MISARRFFATFPPDLIEPCIKAGCAYFLPGNYLSGINGPGDNRFSAMIYIQKWLHLGTLGAKLQNAVGHSGKTFYKFCCSLIKGRNGNTVSKLPGAYPEKTPGLQGRLFPYFIEYGSSISY